MSQLPWHSQLQQTLTDRKAAGLYRRTRLRDGEQGVEVVLDGRKLLSFSSNDYLGLAAHPTLKKAFAHKGPALINIFTDPEALAMPPKVSFEQVKGFATSMGKMMLNGQSAEVIDLSLIHI